MANLGARDLIAHFLALQQRPLIQGAALKAAALQ